MSFKVLQFSPQQGTRVIRMRGIPEAWSGSNPWARDTGFLSSWLEDDSDEANREARRLNWGPISGLALSIAISAGFWTSVVLTIERILR